MKAIVQTGYGSPDVLQLREIDPPVVRDDEVLVRVRAASVHPDVWHVMTGQPYVLRLMGSGLRRPKRQVPGTDLAGQVESVGRDVTRFRPGDEVFGESVRGHQWRNGGAFAELASVPEGALAGKPGNVSFAQAAAVPTSGLIALSNLSALLDRLRLTPGRRVLVNGAAGGVGGIAVQLAAAAGAQVTGVDHPEKLELVRSLGAARVIDHTREDFTRGGERYDLIVDIPGNHRFSDCRRVLTPAGTYLLIGHDQFGGAGARWFGSLPRFLGLAARSLFVRQLPGLRFSTPGKQEAMAVLSELLAAGTLRPVVDRTYPLGQVPEAIRHLATGTVRGKVVITVPE
jgi:NADPH:quinone reductase-like Zn-dependent oxidoreductase